MRITESEWVKEWQRLSRRKVDGHTTRELAAIWGLCLRVTRERLRDLCESGMARMVGHRSETRMDGRPNQTPVYKLVERKRR